MEPPNATLAIRPQSESSVVMGFENSTTFEFMQRAAKLLTHSTLVPPQYRAFKEIKEYGKVIRTEENPNAIANCVIALNIARRMGADELMVMQNLYVVEGRPSWSAQWVIAAINTCGKFTPVRFDERDLGEKEVEYTVVEWNDNKKSNRKVKEKIRNLQTIAWTLEKGARLPDGVSTLEDAIAAKVPVLKSVPVTMEMAVKEGWYGKAGSKWQTMPALMLTYRAASFFGRVYAPELLMGLPTADEVQDEPPPIREVSGREIPAAEVPEARQLFSGAGADPAGETDAGAHKGPPPETATAAAAAPARAPRKPRESKGPAPAVSQEPAPAEPELIPAEPPPQLTRLQEFWKRVQFANLNPLSVMKALRDNAVTDALLPGELPEEDAARVVTDDMWPKFLAYMQSVPAATEGGSK